MSECDELDGVENHLLENPLDCTFDLDSLACPGGGEAPRTYGHSECLSTAEIGSIKAFYAGPKRSDNGEQLYPGFPYGSEKHWKLQEVNLINHTAVPILQNLVFDDLKYNFSYFNWASDVDAVVEKVGKLTDAVSLDLRTFRSAGGKLLVSQGWADNHNAATWPIEHLDAQEVYFGEKVDDFYNLFMVPGGGHCGAAQYYPWVPATHMFLSALVDWVESGQQPQEVQSIDPPDGGNRTRKLCAWPNTAVHVEGDVNDWSSYICTTS